MAVSVASSTSNTVAVDTSLVIAKPSGLAVGDGLVACIYSYSTSGGLVTQNTPAGWELATNATNNAAADNQGLYIFVKIADSSDVAASDFTFTTTGTNNIYGSLIRTTGSRTDDLISSGAGDSDDTQDDTTNPTHAISITPAQNTVLYVFAVAGAANEVWADTTSPVINGTNPTWTKQYNGVFDVFTAPVETTAAITGVTGTESSMSTNTDWISSFVVINGQIDANGVLTTTVTGNTAFAPGGSAGARTSLTTTTVTENQAFDPVGRGSRGTPWTNEPLPTTTWTNEPV